MQQRSMLLTLLTAPPHCIAGWSRHPILQVDLSSITFRYPTRTDIVALEDVTLKLEPGKLVALVGLSGSGKSTLVALLQRLYDPNSGQVFCCSPEK